MKHMRTIAIAVVALAGAGVVLELTAPKAMHAAVTTLVAVVNTPNVNVANTPNVAVSGSVAVANGTDAAGRPVVVTDGNAPRNSFSATGSCNLAVLTGCTASALYTVPAGEVAVVQSFSGLCALNVTGDQVYEVSLVQESTQNQVFAAVGAPVQVSHLFGPTYTLQTFHQNTTLYVPAGASVDGRADSALQFSGGGTGTCSFWMSGYLAHE